MGRMSPAGDCLQQMNPRQMRSLLCTVRCVSPLHTGRIPSHVTCLPSRTACRVDILASGVAPAAGRSLLQGGRHVERRLPPGQRVSASQACRAAERVGRIFDRCCCVAGLFGLTCARSVDCISCPNIHQRARSTHARTHARTHTKHPRRVDYV